MILCGCLAWGHMFVPTKKPTDISRSKWLMYVVVLDKTFSKIAEGYN